ncbi:MAG TPA: hypothetical protein VHR36_02735 [Pyrinomonadaceae bacterium]|jgi:hypothetical protein|nr:hypothetical protein [Pyrinomonadaceae bacterium]
MRTFVLFIAFLFVVILSNGPGTSVTSANAGKKQKAVVNFDQPVRLMNVTLKGEYLLVHDDAAMARGEACTFIYKGLNETPKKLVVSFHCTPSPREKADNFRMRLSRLASGEYELTEFQFAGSTEVHFVPSSQLGEHVNVALN